jgi:hypothetical protein|tara:strand:+ start:66 stop:1145 length:1080 start_codon:yes stop_codon:yes gene_type:complete
MSKARELAELGAVYNSGALSNRNMIINGAMQVAQRKTSGTDIGADGTAYITLDRWLIETGGSNSGRFTMSQSSDAPSGFGNSLKLDCTTADTSIGSNEYLLLQYRIEGHDVQRIKKGTSDAEEVTISFYVKANAAFNFVLEFYDNDNNRTCSKLFSTTTGWNRVELTYPADTTGAFDDDSNASVRLFFWIHAGSTYTSGTLNSSAFNTQNNANRAPGISSLYSSTSNELYITGVQMEVGSEASPFEHRSFGEELGKCMRYFYKSNYGATFTTGDLYFGRDTRVLQISFPTNMRANPSVTTCNDVSVSSGGGSGHYVVHGVNNYTDGTNLHSTPNQFTMYTPNRSTSQPTKTGFIADAEI